MDDAYAVYRAPGGRAHGACMLTAPPPPSADDFEPTPAELKAAFADAIEQRNGPNAPLMTSAMRARRDAERARGRPQYTSVRVRVRFADRSQVEKTFDIGAHIADVYAFVDALRDGAADYTLFQSPPRRDFARDEPQTLGALGFAPAAVLGIRWAAAQLNGALLLTASDAPPPLKTDVRARARDMPAAPAFGGAVPAVRAPDGEARERKFPKVRHRLPVVPQHGRKCARGQKIDHVNYIPTGPGRPHQFHHVAVEPVLQRYREAQLDLVRGR